MFKLCVLLAVPLVCSGFLFGNSATWDGLKVTWGINPLSSFNSMPRTRQDAENQGWNAMDAGAACNANPKFVGQRYIKSGDTAVILIYDVNGYIAGIQLGFAQNYSPNVNNYPFPPLTGHPVIAHDDGNYYVTAYFINPADVCKGRTAGQFVAEGTGTGLWIQNGSNPLNPLDLAVIPLTEAEADASPWTRGACFYTMGRHYWYQLSKDMDCNNLYPVFLLYNKGKLNGFGWALAMDLENYSNRIEHPPQSSYSNFMTPPPDCLSTLGTMTTLHIYLTSSTITDLC